MTLRLSHKCFPN